MIRRIGPGTDRIAALVRSNGEISRLPHGMHLGIPEES
jgi:hypothetical protein